MESYIHTDGNYDAAIEELEANGVESQTIEYITSINGASLDTLRDVLYCATGERTFSFEPSEDGEEA